MTTCVCDISQCQLCHNTVNYFQRNGMYIASSCTMLQLLRIRIEIPLACDASRLESENCPHTILNDKWVITWSWMTSSGSIHTRVWQLISWLMDWTEAVNYISACSTGVKRSRLTPCHVAMLVCFNKCLLLSVWSVLSVKWFVLCTANVMTFIGIPQSAFIDN